MKLLKQILLGLYGFALFNVFVACDQYSTQSIEKPNETDDFGEIYNLGSGVSYSIYDTGIPVEFRNKNLFWISDNAILFNEKISSDELGVTSIDTMVFDTKEKKRYSIVADIKNKIGLKCKHKDNFYYFVEESKGQGRGKFGRFVINDKYYSFVEFSPEVDFDKRSIDSFDGRCVNRSVSDNPNVKEIIYLLEFGGQIRIGRDGSIAFSTTEEKGLFSVAGVRNVYWHTLGYSEMLSAYYVTGSDKTSLEQAKLVGEDDNSSPENNYYNILMHESGQLEVIKISEIPTENIPKIADTVWTRAGLVFRSSLRKAENKTQQIDGLYYWSAQSGFVLVIEGVVGEYTVSPNGCSVALDHFSKEDLSVVNKANPTLKIIDFCR